MKMAIMGGDMRMLTAGELFANQGCQCIAFGFGEHCKGFSQTEDPEFVISQADGVLLPLPFEKDGFLNAPFSDIKIKAQDIFGMGKENTLFFGGKLKQETENIIDYSIREDFQLFNAVPTAEGAIGIAMKESKKTLRDSRAVIVGYGRIGHCLAELLKAFGTKICVVARSPKSRAQATIRGHETAGFDNWEASLSKADLIFNTVPFKVFGKKELSFINPNCPLIDLASLPYGADEKECIKADVKLIRALGLPGKIAPETAGKIIFTTVRDILFERGIKI